MLLGLGIDFKSPKGVKPSHDLKKLFGDVMEKYSMIPLVESWGYRFNETKGGTETVTNYINVIDLCNNARKVD